MSNRLEIPQDKRQIVEVILKSADLYKCVFVTKQATTVEISKQFKKVSVLVHPDKNDHPKASDAFKKVGEAKRILTDDTARRRYDQTGSTSERPTPEEYFGGGRRSYGSSYGPTAEDIFEQFFRQSGARSRHSGRGGRDFYADDNPFFSAGFGGGNPFFQPRPQQQQQYRQYTQSTHPFSGNFMGPLLGALAFLVLIFLISSIGRATSPSAPEGFSLWQTDHFSVPHYTADGLAYWLSPGYLDSATLLRESSRRSMDRKVFDAWYKFKESECQQDLSQGRRSGAPSRPKSCVEFDEIKLMRSQRSW